MHEIDSSPDNECLFDFNAMLMYGWVADKDLKVRGVNKMLKHQLVTNKLQQLNEDVETEGVEIGLFLTRLLTEADQEIGKLIPKALRELANHIEESAPETDLSALSTEEQHGDYRILIMVPKLPTPASVLAGVRLVKVGGLRLLWGGEDNRVDLITICQVVKKDSGWQVRGFQGQLQEAWLRVETAIIQGTKAGSIGLMSRNLPHNMGSHALYWLEQDTVGDKTGLFYRYLRERMELLAGFATTVPITWATTHLKIVIKGFTENRLLLDRIGKSEGVKKVEVEVDLPSGDDMTIALPGGTLGAQALYMILENIIRDSAKYGRTSRGVRPSTTLRFNVRVAKPTDERLAEDYVQVVVNDELNNYKRAAGDINKELDELRIADEGGRLVPGGWGIKERFIAAAFLRGIRLEDILLRHERKGTINLRLGRKEPDGLPILELTQVGGHLGWLFYLLKAKGVLLVTDDRTHETPQLTVKDFNWLRENLDRGKSIRHRFVVLCPRTQEQIDWLKGKAAWLPCRVFMCLPEGLTLDEASVFLRLPGHLRIEELSPLTLYQEWVLQLLRCRNPLPAIVSIDDGFVRPEIALNRPDMPRVFTLSNNDWLNWPNRKEWGPKPRGAGLLQFSSHGSVRPDNETEPLLYEPHNSEDPVRQIIGKGMMPKKGTEDLNLLAWELTEAALTRVLIVDERLDVVSEDRKYRNINYPECSYKELFRWKGIDLRGKEYGPEMVIPSAETLLKWVKGKDYDFVLLHLGIIDKLDKYHGKTPKDLCQELCNSARYLVIHSGGRMDLGRILDGLRCLPFSNVAAWIDRNYAKKQIVEELQLLRRVNQ